MMEHVAASLLQYLAGCCIVAKCPGMTGTVPEFLHLSRSCPG